MTLAGSRQVLRGIAYGRDSFVAVGYAGSILQTATNTPPTITVTPTNISFTATPTFSSVSQSVTIGNTGTTSLTVSAITIGRNQLQRLQYSPGYLHQLNSDSSYDPPPFGRVFINNGAPATYDPNITLTLSAFDNSGSVVSMRFSNNNFSWSSWELYNNSKNWSLSILGGDGLKTVYVQFKDEAGNISGSYFGTIRNLGKLWNGRWSTSTPIRVIIGIRFTIAHGRQPFCCTGVFASCQAVG